MIKLIGAILLVSACGYAGWHVSRSYARRPVELRQFMTALQMLETEITYAATPLPDALSGIAERVDARVSSFFAHAAKELQTTRGTSARQAWSAALDRYRTGSTLDRGDLGILNSLGHNLGISDRDDQAKHLRLTLEQLKMAQARAEETASKNVKLWNYVGLLGGLIIVLALY
ncbi:MAG: stage III sporulation protein AB [Peptococcaceae bacterium BRH_c8a]|nr:MAG: stage III sporulation protein AB [Peptococcaceae bacterium BRH_c8a]